MYKKLLCFLSFFILLFLFTTKILAFDQFIKYEENPLQLNIDTKYSTIRQAHLYKIENLYEGVITLFDSFKNKFLLSSISSLDGINWKFKKEIFINDESQEFSNPRVFIDDNGNKHLFFANWKITIFCKSII
jgi:predicted RNA-binding protein associated with RNAse of E/G family